MSENHQKPISHGEDAALLGVPTGESLSRAQVDGLIYSPKQAKRPAGVSRADYMDAEPGRDTAVYVELAGISNTKRRVALGIGAALVLGLGILAVILLGP